MWGDTPHAIQEGGSEWLGGDAEGRSLRKTVSVETNAQLTEERRGFMPANFTSAVHLVGITSYVLPAWMIRRLLLENA